MITWEIHLVETTLSQDSITEVPSEFISVRFQNTDRKEKDMAEYIIPMEIELSDIQAVEAILEAKLDHIKTNYPYATHEINEIETALKVINDLIMDI